MAICEIVYHIQLAESYVSGVLLHGHKHVHAKERAYNINMFIQKKERNSNNN